jgi:hypothetical protein
MRRFTLLGVWYAVLALVNLLAGGFLATSTYGFDASTTADIGLAVSIVVLMVGATMGYVGYMRSKDEIIRLSLGLLGWMTAGLASWTIIATQAFEPTTSRWLVFASGLGHISLSVAGIITHEATLQRR